MRTFGKFRIVEPLASGGMADVFRAEVEGAAGVTKEVALKLVRGEHAASSEFVQMFIQEARLASRLTHANIVQVFEFDQIEGRYYIAMELVRGRNLARVVERCRELGVRLGLPRVVHLGAEIAKGLAYAHRLAGPDGAPLGVVHRDVSPHNVLVSFEGEVKIADFGIARVLDRAGATEPGTIKGKLAYMAPEQARVEPVDARADVFSLGVILWELCTGRRLHARDGDAATLHALLGPEPASAPSEWNEAVGPELDALVRGALEKDRARRTASADDIARGLSRVLLRIASGPEDWDLRALMHRLWPDGATPQPGPATGATRVRASPAPAPAAAAPAPAQEATTRTAPAPPRPRWRRLGAWGLAVGALTAAIAAAVAGQGRGRAPPDAAARPDAAAPAPAAAAPSTAPLREPTPVPVPAAAAAVAPAPAGTGASADSRSVTKVSGVPARAAAAGGAAPTRSRRTGSAPAWLRAHEGGGARLPVPARASGDGLVLVEVSPWAVLFVNGFEVGETPQDVRLAAGRRYRFRVEHPTKGAAEKVIEVVAGERQTWANAALKR